MFNREAAHAKARALVSKMTLEEKMSQLVYGAPAIERQRDRKLARFARGDDSIGHVRREGRAGYAWVPAEFGPARVAP